MVANGLGSHSISIAGRPLIHRLCLTVGATSLLRLYQVLLMELNLECRMV